MTILVTAFASAGAGVAYSHMSAGSSLAARSGAGQVVAHLIAMRGTCPVDGCAALGVDQTEDSPYAGGPLASYSFVGAPATSYGTAAEDQNDATPVLGKDMPEESTNPAAIYRSEESPGAGTSTSPGSGSGSGTGKGHHHGGTGTGKGHHGGTGGTGPGTGKGHHHGGSGGSGAGKGHHHGGAGGSGAGAGKGTGKGHHGTGAGGSGSKSGHHGAGGMGASSGATSAGESSAADENSATDNNVASDEMAENGASAASGSNSAASQQSTLPTTGAPLAGLLGLAVLAVGAGVFLRLRSKRDDEDQPEES
jgi:hypothetical protein